jgi:hypothetical protein
MQTTLYEWLNRRIEREEDAATDHKDESGISGQIVRRLHATRRDAFREMLEDIPILAAEMII